ncbi:hypothetical protein TNIN_191191 [Trichonephila inaurata madagascariensis]|uniref:C2H2-type domain-containing protein n=1 Tax=Trichonephila inaurata madagascariensis TaxID=2747483 RepID=A0A8X6XTM6_9ARAC|nr:hypothetical protein TNIN_191191 [Trichonephila inaurata madagascariensis]
MNNSKEESPIAFRTRGTYTFEEAATNGFCKLCAARFPTMEGLWTHLRDEHSEPSSRKTLAMEAFPIFFRLDRLQDVLPTQDVVASTPTLMPMGNCSPHGSPRVLESTRIEELFVGSEPDPPLPRAPFPRRTMWENFRGKPQDVSAPFNEHSRWENPSVPRGQGRSS